MEQESFRIMMKDEFIRYTDQCVEDFLNGNLRSLFTHTKKLSQLVLKNFKPMIPPQFHALWKKGLETNDYYLKLCGSGGEGIFLGLQKILRKLKLHSKIIVCK